jgi:hypothetical protein
MLWLPCWLHTDALGGANTEEEIIRRGFDIEKEGLTIRVGGFADIAKKDGEVHPRKALFCKVAVGRAFVMDEFSAQHESIPKGYDSFYLQGLTLPLTNRYFIHLNLS